MLVLTVHKHIKPDTLETFLTEAQKMLAPSQAEDGCISYKFFSDPHNPTHVVFVEEWESQAHLDAHCQTDHFMAYKAATDDLLAKPGVVTAYDATKL